MSRRDQIDPFIAALESELPSDSAVEGDRTGFQLRTRESSIGRVGLCYEVTDAVVDEAIRSRCELLLCFHPLLYRGSTSFDVDRRVDRTFLRLASESIDLYSIHTRLDTHPRGSNVLLAEALGLEVESAIETVEGSRFGMGVIGRLPDPMSYAGVVERIGEVTGSTSLRFSSRKPVNPISRIGIVVGSGASYYRKAIGAGAELFITGDVHYHDFHAANDDDAIPIIDPGHDRSERFVLDSLRSLVDQISAGLETPVEVVSIDVSTCPYRTIDG